MLLVSVSTFLILYPAESGDVSLGQLAHLLGGGQEVRAPATGSDRIRGNPCQPSLRNDERLVRGSGRCDSWPHGRRSYREAGAPDDLPRPGHNAAAAPGILQGSPGTADPARGATPEQLAMVDEINDLTDILREKFGEDGSTWPTDDPIFQERYQNSNHQRSESHLFDTVPCIHQPLIVLLR